MLNVKNEMTELERCHEQCFVILTCSEGGGIKEMDEQQNEAASLIPADG